jgi:uncharacterized protein
MAEILANLLMQHRKLLFISLILSLIAASIFLRFPEFSGSLNGFELKDNKFHLAALEKDSLFGDQNRIYIHIMPKNTSASLVFSSVKQIEDSLNQVFPGSNLFSLRDLYKRDMVGRKVNPEISGFLNYASGIPIVTDLISHDKTSFLLILNLPKIENVNTSSLDEILKSSYPGIQNIEAISIFHVQNSIEKHIRRDLGVISLAVISFFLFFYWYIYRNFGAILFTVINIGMAIYGTLFFFYIFNIDLNIISILVIPVVLILSLADSVHLITGMATVPSVSKEDKVKETLKLYIIPSFYSSLTTSIAFFTFYFFNESAYIREFGLITGFALLAEFFITFLLAPYFLEKINITKVYGKNISLVNSFFAKKRLIISVCLLLVLPGSLFFVKHLEFRTSSESFFPVNSELSNIHRRFNEKFYSSIKLDLLVSESGNKNDGEKLNQLVKELTENIKTKPGVVAVTTSMDRVQLPGTVGSTSITSFLKTNPYYNKENEVYRIEVGFKEGDDIGTFFKNEYSSLEKIAGSEFSLRATSPFLIMEAVNESVAGSLIASLTTSFLSIIFLIFLLTRSLTLTFISIIPNIVPLAVVAVIFVLLDLDLNILTAITAVVCIGILDDDTIHILYRKVWLKKDLNEVSFSIFSTSILLAVGFGFLLLSSFEPTRIFGLVCAVVFLVGVISDLTLMPLTIDKWYSLKNKNI